MLVDNSDIPEDLCRHLFLSFIKKPAIILPIDTPPTIGVLPLATAAIPPLPAVTTTTISTGSSSTSATITSSPPPPPLAAHRTFDIADRLSGFSIFSDRFFQKKRGLTNFNDDTGTSGSIDAKARSGTLNNSLILSFYFSLYFTGICSAGKTTLMRRDNSHDQHNDSSGNSRQSSRKSNPSIHSIHSLHPNSKRERLFSLKKKTSLHSDVSPVTTSDDPWVFRTSLSQLLSKISGNDLTRDGYHHHLPFNSHHNTAQQHAALIQSQEIDINTARIKFKDIICYFSLLEGGTPEQKLECKSLISIPRSPLSLSPSFFFKIVMFKIYDEDSNGILDKQVGE